MWQGIYEERRESFIIYERSLITMKLLWHSYLVLNLSTRVMKLCTETDLIGEIFGN
jgi:hypothetical protein